jgi:hypothetical protein
MRRDVIIIISVGLSWVTNELKNFSSSSKQIESKSPITDENVSLINNH